VTDRIELPHARIVTMRELNQHTAAVMDEVNRSGRPAVISKHGQFVALITPLAGHSIESMVLAGDPELRDLVQEELKHAEESRGTDLSVDEAREWLDNHGRK